MPLHFKGSIPATDKIRRLPCLIMPIYYR